MKRAYQHVTVYMLSALSLWVLSSCSFSGKINEIKPSSSSSGNEANFGNLTPFAISGITGGTDTSLDNNLNSTLSPSVAWSASTGASSYEAVVYANDGVTTVCALQSTTNTGLDFSTCTLTAGMNYKVAVWAKVSTSSNRMAASNSPYSFYTNRNPVVGNDTITMMFNGAGLTGLNPITNGTGLDSDPDGDTLTITSVSTASKGTASLSGGTSIGYAPGGTAYGADSFTYTVSDGRGGTATATVNVRLMTQYTWTGVTNTTWNTGGNWCGSVSTPGFSGTCAGAGPAPSSATTTTHIAVFNELCTTNCSPTISANAAMYKLDISSGYSGTITQSNGFTMTVGQGGWFMAGGSFMGGNSAITVGSTSDNCDTNNQAANITTTGTFRSTSGTFRVNVCSLTMTPGTFQNNNGLVMVNKQWVATGMQQTVITGSSVLYDFSMTGTSANMSLGNGTITVSRHLTLDRPNAQDGRPIDGSFNVGGNITLTTCRGDTSYSVVMNGTNQTINGTDGCALGNLTVNSTGTLTLSGNVNLAGHYINNAPSLTATGSTLKLLGALNSYTATMGSVNYNNLLIEGSQPTYNFGSTTVNVNGDLTIGDTSFNSGYLNNVTFNVLGNLTLTGYGKGRGNDVINLNGVNQTITGVSTAELVNLNVNSTGTVTMVGDIRINNTYAFNASTLVATGSTLRFKGNNATYTATMGSVTYNNIAFEGSQPIYNFGSTTVNVGGSLTLGDSSFNGSTLNNVTFNLAGNLNLTNYGSFGNYVVTLSGVNQTITGASNAFLGNVNINSTGTVSLSGNIFLYNNFYFNTGTLSAAGSTVTFVQRSGSYNFKPGSGTYGNVTFDFPGSAVTIDLGAGNLNMAGTLTRTSGASPSTELNNGTVKLNGNLNFLGSGMYGSAIIQILGLARTMTVGAGSNLLDGAIVIGDGATATSVTAGSNLLLNRVSQDMTIQNNATLNMAGYNLTVSNSSGTDNVLTVAAGGTLNMGGGTRTQESLVNSGTINP